MGWWALLPLALCALIVVPGVVDEGDLDAKWINVVPALGVAIVLVLTAGCPGGSAAAGDLARRPPPNRRRRRARPIRAPVDLRRARRLLDIPGLACSSRSSSIQGEASVHLGEHHGFEGYLLVLTALLLSRQLPDAAPERPRRVPLADDPVRLGNMLNDGWNEQIVKRGWTAGRSRVSSSRATWMWGS